MLIERLTVVLNDNADTTDISKIATQLSVPRASNDTRKNNSRYAQGQEVPVNLLWIPLEQDENNASTVTMLLHAMQKILY